MDDQDTPQLPAVQQDNTGGGLYPGLHMPGVYEFCRNVVISGLVTANKPEEALVIILAGREYGLSPMAALMNGHMIKGKFSLSADMMAAIATSKGAVLELVASDGECATYSFDGRGRSAPFLFSYTLDDAKQAGLYPGKQDSNWRKHTKAMLRARAISQGIKAAFPGMMSGAYLADELQEIATRARPASRQLPDHTSLVPDAAAPEHAVVEQVEHERVEPGPVPADGPDDMHPAAPADDGGDVW